MRAAVVANQFENPFHGSGYSRHVLPDEFRQRIGGSGKLVVRLVHLQHILVRHGHEQVQLVRKIIDDARLGQSAGSGKRDDACLLIVHPDKYPECPVMISSRLVIMLMRRFMFFGQRR